MLTGQGVLSVWSARAAPEFTRVLESRFDRVTVLEIPLLPGRRGDPDVVILASGVRERSPGRKRRVPVRPPAREQRAQHGH